MRWDEDDEKQAGAFEAEGCYPFEVVESVEKVSKAGNPYINVKLLIYVDETERTMYDVLTPKMPDKMRAFCEVTGLEDKYRLRSLDAADCLHKQGFIRLGKKPDDRGFFKVETYLDRDPGVGTPPPKQEMRKPISKSSLDRMNEEDPSIPF